MGLQAAVNQAKEMIHLTEKSKRIEIDKPRWDQSNYWGRAQHFWATTNPFNILYSETELDKAKDIVTRYRQGENIPNLTDDELWKNKHLYDSAFHPETGEKTFILGRMSAQAPMNMIITGCMLTFYQSTPAAVFWQWFNQSFNAVVNFCNRSGTEDIGTSDMMTSYVTATTGALVTALGLNKLARRAPPLIGRLVPFAAVVAANAVNIPLVRQREIKDGLKIMSDKGDNLGYSSTTAKIAISQVVLSRAMMAVPTMVLLPVMMNKMDKMGILKKYPRLPLPFQLISCGVILTFATPLCCAIFPQTASIPVTFLEAPLQEKLKALPNPPTLVYYNKGL